MHGAMRVAHWPEESRNPYLRLFYEALEPYGVSTVSGFSFSLRWLWQARNEIDAVHFHWPDRLWEGRHENSDRALLKLYAFLVLAGWLGIKRIWTVHNLDPHEGESRADRRGQDLLARHCDLLIVHSRLTERKVLAKLKPRGKIIVMPHGNYDGHYPQPRPRAVVIEEFDLRDNLPVLCCLGRLREYKGLDIACDALRYLGEDVQLIIGGVPHRGFDLAPLERSAAQLPNLALIPRMLSDQELVDLLSVSDAALLPYRKITGSGALLAAWTEGCGVIASDLDFFQEMISETSTAGRLFSAGDAQALALAVRDYLAAPEQERRKGARAEAEKYAWDRCVGPVGEQLLAWQGREAKPQQRTDELHVENVYG